MKPEHVKQQKKRNRILAVSVSALIIMVASFSFCVVSYLHQFDKILLEENEVRLSESAQQIALYMKSHIKTCQSALVITAKTVQELPQEKRMEYLKRVEKESEFTYVGYAGTDGIMSATVDSESKNLSGEPYFKEVMAGNAVVTDMVLHIFDDRAVSGIILAVPMKRTDGTVSGILTAMLDIDRLRGGMSIPTFGGEGSLYVTNQVGELVLRNKSMSLSNWFTLLKNVNFQKNYQYNHVRDDFTAQREGMILYNELGTDKIAYYCPIGINQWMVINIVEKGVITSKTDAFTQNITMMSAVAIIIFLLLLIAAAVMFGLSESRRRATEQKSTFLANMSHEIRTPMNAIVGISEILLREGLSARQHDYVLSIANSGKGLLTIINDILDFSKIEAGKFSIMEEPYELESVLYDVTSIIAVRIADKPVEFLIDVNPDVPRVLMGDMTRIKQILINIAGNAAKFTDKGLIRLDISSREHEGKVLLTMAVSDTGTGIKRQDLEKLFISFNQVDTHHHHGKEGTGLGLAISKQLCGMMGGDISVESEYGVGSVFTVTLHQGKINETPIIDQSNFSESKILLFEQNGDIIPFLRDSMDQLHLEYLICRDQPEFEQYFGRGGFTHVIADRISIRQAMLKGTGGSVNYISLLGLKEQSHMPMGMDRSSIYIPLFGLQLSFILNINTADEHTLKRAGVDMTGITPMPFTRILVVDDNEVNLQVAAGLMAPYDMKIHCVLSGREAVKAVQEAEYDLILMDHMMPEMDGVETLKAIRNLPEEKYKAVPIVALTANAASDAKNMFIQAGFNDFMAKPIETKQLDMVLRKWLKELNEMRQKEAPDVPGHIESPPSQMSAEAALFLNDFQAAREMDFKKGCAELGSIESYISILRTYIKSVSQKLDQLPEWFNSDYERYLVEIHGLKGASGAVGAMGITKFAARLEGMGKRNDLEHSKEDLPSFIERCRYSVKEAEEFVQAFIMEQEIKENNTAQPEKEVIALTYELLEKLNGAFLDYDTEWLKQFFEETGYSEESDAESTLIRELRRDFDAYEFEHPLELIAHYIESNTNK